MVDRRFMVPVLFTIDKCQWFFFPSSFFFVPSCCFAPAHANSLLNPSKGFWPHNTKQISIAAYSYYSTAGEPLVLCSAFIGLMTNLCIYV